jgi:hypothetical protein
MLFSGITLFAEAGWDGLPAPASPFRWFVVLGDPESRDGVRSSHRQTVGQAEHSHIVVFE